MSTFAILPLLVLVLAALLGCASAQLTACFQQGYNLTAITGADLLINSTGHADGSGTSYTWAIRPCGFVSTAGFCTGQAGEFCQGSTTVSSTNWTGAGVGSGALWGQLSLNGQYGVAQFLQDGTSCNGNGDREGTIVFLCNATATSPFISSLLELSTCNYQAVIQTSIVCPQVPAAGFSTSVGTSIITNACGGGIYDLSSLNSADIIGTGNGYYWAMRVCGVVGVQNCTGASLNTSICQFNGTGWAVSEYLPTTSNTFYTYLAPGAMSQITQDGQACGGQYRMTNVTFVCDQSATTPVMLSPVEYVQCHYLFIVQTNAVCGSAFAGVQPSGSSSGAAFTGASSAAATSVQVSVSSASAATSAPAQNSTSAVGTSPVSPATSTPASSSGITPTSTPASSAVSAASSPAAPTSTPVVFLSSTIPTSSPTPGASSPASSAAAATSTPTPTASVSSSSATPSPTPSPTSPASSSSATPGVTPSPTSATSSSSFVVPPVASSSTGGGATTPVLSGAVATSSSSVALLTLAFAGLTALLLA